MFESLKGLQAGLHDYDGTPAVPYSCCQWKFERSLPRRLELSSFTVACMPADGYRGSIKMHKDRGSPLVLGPIWDLNEAFGLCCGYPIEGAAE